MHPTNYLDGKEDSIADAHMRLDRQFQRALTEYNRPRRKARALRHGRNGSGKRVRLNQAGASVVMLAALKHRQMWMENYIGEGALDEQISNRVRDESKVFWLARDEANIKLLELARQCKRVDLKLEALGEAFGIINQLDFQKFVLNDAVPWQYRLQLKRVAAAIKQALAA